MLKDHLQPADFATWKALQEIMPTAFELRTDAYGQDVFDLSLYAANVLTSLKGIDEQTLLLSLIMPYAQLGLLTVEECEKKFSPQTAQLLDTALQIRQFTLTDSNWTDKELSGLFISLAKDIRVVIYFTVDCYVRMQAIADDPIDDYSRSLATASKAFYAPLAHKLGLFELKRDLENLAVKFTDPEVYNYIRKSLKSTREQRDEYLKKVVDTLKDRIKGVGIKYEVKYRTKSISSIYAKMKNKGVDLDGMYDLYALRIIVDAEPAMEKAACWAMYGLTTSVFLPNLLRTKDWISSPKSSGYESLHTTVLGPDDHWIEVQIRSRRMDEVAELGQAAHWRYKGEQGNDELLNDALTSIRAAIEQHSNMAEVAERFAQDMYSNEIFIFDNADHLHRIPTDSRVIDYIIHIAPEADWVELFNGARVNGEQRPLSYPLHNGDRVELTII